MEDEEPPKFKVLINGVYEMPVLADCGARSNAAMSMSHVKQLCPRTCNGLQVLFFFFLSGFNLIAPSTEAADILSFKQFKKALQCIADESDKDHRDMESVLKEQISVDFSMTHVKTRMFNYMCLINR